MYTNLIRVELLSYSLSPFIEVLNSFFFLKI